MTRSIEQERPKGSVRIPINIQFQHMETAALLVTPSWSAILCLPAHFVIMLIIFVLKMKRGHQYKPGYSSVVPGQSRSRTTVLPYRNHITVGWVTTPAMHFQFICNDRRRLKHPTEYVARPIGQISAIKPVYRFSSTLQNWFMQSFCWALFNQNSGSRFAMILRLKVVALTTFIEPMLFISLPSK